MVATPKGLAAAAILAALVTAARPPGVVEPNRLAALTKKIKVRALLSKRSQPEDGVGQHWPDTQCSCKFPPMLPTVYPDFKSTPPPTTPVPITTKKPPATEPPTTPPALAKLPPGKLPPAETTTPIPKPGVEVEVLTTNISLADTVRFKNATLGKEIAELAGVPEWRVKVNWQSYPPTPYPFEPYLDEAKSAAIGYPGPSDECECDKTGPPTGEGSKNRIPGPTGYPGYSSSMVTDLSNYLKLQNMGLVGPSRGAGGRIQLLTQDPCFVNLLRSYTPIYRLWLSLRLNLPQKYVVILPPFLEGDTTPAPPPVLVPATGAPGASLLQMGAQTRACELPFELRTMEQSEKEMGAPADPDQLPSMPAELEALLQTSQSPTMEEVVQLAKLAREKEQAAREPAPAPAGAAPAPASPAPAPTGVPTTTTGPESRPWIAVWNIIIAPPNVTFDAVAMADALRKEINDPQGRFAQDFPDTLARVPTIEYPGFWKSGLGPRLLPEPSRVSDPVGYNAGGLRTGPVGFPLGKPKDLMYGIEEHAEASIKLGLKIKDLIKQVATRVKLASKVYKNAVHFDPKEPLQIVPPMVVSDGPDGIHTESPYGPWAPGPPFALGYVKPGMPEPPAYEPNPIDAFKAGGYEQLMKNIMATPIPPLPEAPGPAAAPAAGAEAFKEVYGISLLHRGVPRPMKPWGHEA